MMPVIISTVVMIAAGIALTHPFELREGRWWKIAASIPFAILIGLSYEFIAIGFMAFFAALFIGTVWKENIAFILSGGVVEMTTGASDTIEPNFKLANIEYRDGHFKKALKLAEHELDKDSSHVEGLLFVGKLCAAVDQLDRAMTCVHRVIASAHATDGQKSRALAEKERLEHVLHVRGRRMQEIMK